MSAETKPEYLSVERGMEFIGDAAGFLSLLQTLHKTLKTDIPEISRLLQLSDVPAANRLLHQLKGFTPVFCVDALVEEVIAVEKLSKQGAPQAVREAFVRLSPKLDQLREEVAGHLQAHQISVG